MLQIAVCDDEQFYREKIKCLLEQYLHEHHPEYMVQTFSSGSEFLSVQENNVKYDVVFLDISMEQINGIQTAKQIRTFHSDTFIVFVTAFIDYALECYKVNAIRYILKDQLETAVSECMNAILQKMQKKQVVFAFSDGERALYTDNILYIESSRHKCIFSYMNHSAGETGIVSYPIYEKLDAVEQTLSAYSFLRIHKSYLVNMKHIRRISNYTVFLDTGEELPVPKLRYQAVRAKFVTFKGVF